MPTEIYGVAIVPVIMGLVAVILMVAPELKKFGGLMALVIGVAFGTVYGITEGGWSLLQSIVIGCAFGLAASGLYSTGKNTIQAVSREDE